MYRKLAFKFTFPAPLLRLHAHTCPPHRHEESPELGCEDLFAPMACVSRVPSTCRLRSTTCMPSMRASKTVPSSEANESMGDKVLDKKTQKNHPTQPNHPTVTHPNPTVTQPRVRIAFLEHRFVGMEMGE